MSANPSTGYIGKSSIVEVVGFLVSTRKKPPLAALFAKTTLGAQRALVSTNCGEREAGESRCLRTARRLSELNIQATFQSSTPDNLKYKIKNEV